VGAHQRGPAAGLHGGVEPLQEASVVCCQPRRRGPRPRTWSQRGRCGLPKRLDPCPSLGERLGAWPIAVAVSPKIRDHRLNRYPAITVSHVNTSVRRAETAVYFDSKVVTLRRSRSSAPAWLATLLLILALSRLLLLEEAKPDRRMYPKVPTPQGLLPPEKKYLEWVNSYVSWLVRSARESQIRYNVLLYTGGISALLMPFALYLELPTLVPMVLALIAAASQFLQAAGQHQRLYVLCHAQASKIQRARRDFSFDTREDASSWALRERYNEFRETVEGIKAEYGDELMKVRGQPAPQPEIPAVQSRP
jgi:hypothetical protein